MDAPPVLGLAVEAGWASVRRSPVSTTCFFTSSGRRRARCKARCRTVPGRGHCGFPCAPGVSSTMRISGSRCGRECPFGLGGVLHAGNCTTMRSAPCCWMTGSATPSSLIRLCRQGGDVLFEREFLMRFAASGLSGGDQAQVVAVALFGQLQVGLVVDERRAPCRACRRRGSGW